MRAGYKETSVGIIPEDWDVKKLGELATKLTDGSHFSPIPQKSSAFKIATVKNMMEDTFSYDTCVNISEEDYLSLVNNGCKPEKLDILFSKDGTIGRTFVFNEDLEIVLLSSIAIIRPINHNLNSFFGCHVLKSDIFYNQLEGLKSGSALKRLVLQAIRNIKIPLPPLPEQKKIALILTTVDNKIESIDKQIKSATELKKGLMQKLFSEGLEHTEFKDSPVGKIPAKWEVKTLGDIIIDIKSGLSRKLSIQDIGLPVLRSNNIDNLKVDFNGLKYWYNDDPQGAETSNYFLKDGDILVNFINSMSQIGKTCMFKNEIKRNVIYTTNIMKMTLNDTMNPHFVLYLTKTDNYHNFIMSITKPAINQASFTTKEFRNFKIQCPPLQEQQKIASILTCADDKISVLKEKKDAYTELKKGLMQKLLTGEVRVKVDG